MLTGGVKVSDLLKHVVSAVAQVKEYNWSPETCVSQVVESLERIQKKIADEGIDFHTLTSEELHELGFGKWSDEMPNVFLIPLYLYPCIPDGTTLTCIDGGKYVKGEDKIDLDVRFGCIAYGITVGERNA